MAITESNLQVMSQVSDTPYFELANNYITSILHSAIKHITADFENFDKNCYRIYLQGSYENQTSTNENAKLELVVEFAQNAFGEITDIPAYVTKPRLVGGRFVKERYLNFHPVVELNAIKNCLFDYLIENTKNPNIYKKDKSIAIPATNKIPIEIEILPAYSFETFKFHGKDVKSIIIWDTSVNKYVASFPEIHCTNLKQKNAETDGAYLKVVRILRNLRDILVYNQLIPDGFAPGYFIECLTYNVPNKLYQGTLESIMLKILNYFKNCNLNYCVCAHEQLKLFGTDSDSWTISNAREFINLVIYTWFNFDNE